MMKLMQIDKNRWNQWKSMKSMKIDGNRSMNIDEIDANRYKLDEIHDEIDANQ